MKPLAHSVDHVFVPVPDPAPLFDLFTQDLGLPVAWPIHDYGSFRSGGVSLGRCNVEFVAGDVALNPYFEPLLPAVARGIAFAAVSPETLAGDLDARGIPHMAPLSFDGAGVMGTGTLWNLVFLGGMIGRGAVAFFCDYDMEDVPRGERGEALLASAGGGALGVTGIDEVFVSVSAYEKAAPRWTALLGPSDGEDGRWSLSSGPRIRLREGTRDAIYGLAVRVESVDAAREALMKQGLLGNAKRHSVGLHYPATYGLDVWFVER